MKHDSHETDRHFAAKHHEGEGELGVLVLSNVTLLCFPALHS
jgi:hypothetical protein